MSFKPVFARGLTFLRVGAPSRERHMGWMVCRERLSNRKCDRIVAACLRFEEELFVVDGDRLPEHRKAAMRPLMAAEDIEWFLELICEVAERAATGTTFSFRPVSPRRLR